MRERAQNFIHETKDRVTHSRALRPGLSIALTIGIIGGVILERNKAFDVLGTSLNDTRDAVGTTADNANYGTRVWVADRIMDVSWAAYGVSKLVHPGERGESK